METLIFAIGVLVLFGILAVPISQRIGAPILLLVLGIGMLLGEDGPGGIQFNDFNSAYALGSIALAVILFAGGLETDMRRTKGARVPAVLLATFGVIITAVAVGVIASYVLGTSLELGLLLGAVVASTDAAATFLLIQQSGIGLSDRLRNTLVLESGLNDPIAIFLTVMLTTLVDSGVALSGASLVSSLPLLASQIGLGLVLGIVGGYVTAFIVDRVTLPSGLYPPLVFAFGLVVYSGTALLGGSGFLAVYVCGVLISSLLKTPLERIVQFHEALQWISQILLFLMLGLLVTPSRLVEILPEALVIAAALMFIARPLAVLMIGGPTGFRWNELTFLGWVGLRGAVPIFLAIFPVITPGPVSLEFFNIVFVVVVASLLLQGSTIQILARRLRLAGPKRDTSD